MPAGEVLINMLYMITNVKKQVLIRGVDAEAYRRAKAEASLRGVTMGAAASEALRAWAREGRGETRELSENLNFVKTHWKKLKENTGKAVVVSLGRLQGVFNTYGEACSFSSRFRLALTFVVERPPVARVIEFGPDLALQR